MREPINLTPLGDGWTWRHRAIDLVGQILALVLIAPLVAAHRALGWVLSKILP